MVNQSSARRMKNSDSQRRSSPMIDDSLNPSKGLTVTAPLRQSKDPLAEPSVDDLHAAAQANI